MFTRSFNKRKNLSFFSLYPLGDVKGRLLVSVFGDKSTRLFVPLLNEFLD